MQTGMGSCRGSPKKDSLPVAWSIEKAVIVPEVCPAANRRFPPGEMAKWRGV